MDLKKEDDILETTLSLAGHGYAQAYSFLLDAYEKNPGVCGPQTLYFLACLAGGTTQPAEALGWLRTAIADNGWWYRPEVLEDDDLAPLHDDPGFLALKAISDGRYADAAARSAAQLSWTQKTAGRLLLAVHGNTQNAQTARSDWARMLAGDSRWQLETIQSAEPDGYGTYRWSYDMRAFVPVADAMEQLQREGYEQFACGGFSAGCDMLLRALTFTSARCDTLLLQSPWIPLLQTHADALVQALWQKQPALRIFCGLADEDCLPMAKQLYALAADAGLDGKLTLQEHCRHQFPAEPYTNSGLW